MINTPLSRTFVAALGLSLLVMTPAHAGSLSGKIVFKGTAPKPTEFKTDADPICKRMHKEIASEHYVVAPDGGLKNVFVYVKEGRGPDAGGVPIQAARDRRDGRAEDRDHQRR